MTVQTLVATVDDFDCSLHKRMNLQTDSVIANQCGTNCINSFVYGENQIKYINSDGRGVGKNRNILLDNISADICILADDDETFLDGYADVCQTAFEEVPDADILLFNLVEKNPQRYVNREVFRIGKSNYAKYGAARIAFKGSSITKAGVRFNTHFGGGTEHCAGEDTIFLNDCLNIGLKIYAVPYALAEIDQTAESTWFRGYNEKYFNDKGALYFHIHPVLWPLYGVRFVIKYRKKFADSVSPLRAFRQICKGAIKYILEK